MEKTIIIGLIGLVVIIGVAYQLSQTSTEVETAPIMEAPVVIEGITVAELIDKNIIGGVEVQGIVSDLGEFDCYCFILSSGGEGIEVDYTMASDMDDVQNGDSVSVTGEMMEGGFKLSGIRIIE